MTLMTVKSMSECHVPATGSGIHRKEAGVKDEPRAGFTTRGAKVGSN